MQIKKLLTGGIAGGIVFFLLGWLIYGKLLMGFMNDHQGLAGNISRPEPDFMYLIIGNLAMGFLFAYIFVRSGVTSLAGGLVTGGIVGLLMGVGVDCITYATTTVTSKTAMAADVAGLIVMTAIGGAVIAAVIGMGTKTSA
jgi:hypothetical protein